MRQQAKRGVIRKVEVGEFRNEKNKKGGDPND